MLLYTKHFGEIEYNPDRTITFPSGLPGFLDMRHFLLIENEEAQEGLFYWLQSIDDGELAFVLINLYLIMPDYSPQVDPEEIAEIGPLNSMQPEIYNIAVIPEDINEMRVNLKAPIYINPLTMMGMQVVVNNDNYKIRHYIFEELQKANAASGE